MSTQLIMRRLKTSKGRNRAFQIRAYRNKLTGRKVGHVGITSSRYFWLDLETKSLNAAIEMAHNLMCTRIHQPLYVFKTGKNYWLVGLKPLDWNTIEDAYKYCLQNWEMHICKPFILCCLRYHKATLRVSRKNGNIPECIIKIALPFEVYRP